MSDTIYYNHNANYGHLDDMQNAIQGAQECREGLNAALNALGNSGALVGQAADSHHTVQLQSSQQMDGILGDLQVTHQQGVGAQIDNAQQDNHWANAFGG